MRNIDLIHAKPGYQRAEDHHAHHDEINYRNPKRFNQKTHQPAHKITEDGHQAKPAGGGAALFGRNQIRDQRGDKVQLQHC